MKDMEIRGKDMERLLNQSIADIEKRRQQYNKQKKVEADLREKAQVI